MSEGENMRDSLEDGHDCRVGKLVINTTPPTFSRIMLLLVDIVQEIWKRKTYKNIELTPLTHYEKLGVVPFPLQNWVKLSTQLPSTPFQANNKDVESQENVSEKEHYDSLSGLPDEVVPESEKNISDP
jgi:hypothetical protein